MTPDLKQHISRLLQIHGHALPHVGHLPQRTDQQRRGNGDGLPSALRIDVAELVVQAVLAADERRAECHGHVVAGQARHGRATRVFRADRCNPSRSCRGWPCAADRRRPPRSCGRLHRWRWPPCGTDRGRRSTDSCRRRCTRPRYESSTGRNTAASLGPSFATPTSGLTTLPPCTS